MDTTTLRKAELLGIKLMKVSEGIQGAAHGLFKRHGLSAPQYNVLRILRGAGAAGLRCQEISERMVSRVPDITRLLDRLGDKDLVVRERSVRVQREADAQQADAIQRHQQSDRRREPIVPGRGPGGGWRSQRGLGRSRRHRATSLSSSARPISCRPLNSSPTYRRRLNGLNCGTVE
jgi:DNA-binding MarR family transcriptional regulator